MGRFAAFRFTIDATPGQVVVLARHAGASRFAYNQCLSLVKTALEARTTDSSVHLPWTPFDLINAFNAWKRSAAAGRVMVVAPDGEVSVAASGLAWRSQVCQQVFEEAAVNTGRALAAFTASRRGTRRGRRVGFPRYHRKNRSVASFRIRCKTTSRGRGSIRVGDDHPRAVTLPTIGVLRVREDTRRLRRMLRNARVKILYATVSCRAGRWQICLTVQAADLHPAAQHPSRPTQDTTGWVGVDRGLSTYLVVATGNGQEVLRVADPPRPLRAGTARIRRLSRRVTGKQRGSANRRKAAAKLGRCHQHIRNIRQHFLHQVANQLVKTHDRIALEDLTITGMLTNHHLAAAISDAGWGELARIVGYKQQWRGGHLMLVDKWYPSTRACSRCHTIAPRMPLSVRVFHCASCGHRADRDLNAAVNLATWAEQHHVQVRDLEARGPVTNAPRGEGSDPRHPARVKPAPTTEEPNHHTTV